MSNQIQHTCDLKFRMVIVMIMVMVIDLRMFVEGINKRTLKAL
jgi:uncharacterized membrane protein